MRRMCVLKKSYNPNLSRVYFYERVDSEQDDNILVNVFMSHVSLSPIFQLPIVEVELVTSDEIMWVDGHPFVRNVADSLMVDLRREEIEQYYY